MSIAQQLNKKKRSTNVAVVKPIPPISDSVLSEQEMEEHKGRGNSLNSSISENEPNKYHSATESRVNVIR